MTTPAPATERERIARYLKDRQFITNNLESYTQEIADYILAREAAALDALKPFAEFADADWSVTAWHPIQPGAVLMVDQDGKQITYGDLLAAKAIRAGAKP